MEARLAERASIQRTRLSRLAGVKGTRARLYHDGGYATLDALAATEPQTGHFAVGAPEVRVLIRASVRSR